MYYCCSFLLLYFYLILISFYLWLFCLFWHSNLHAEGKLNKVVVFRYLHIQSELACSRHSDRGDNAKRCEQEKKKQRGGGVGVRARELSLSLFSSLFFSRTLPSRRTRLSERLEQAKSSKKWIHRQITLTTNFAVDVYNCGYKYLTKGLNGVNSELSNGQLSKMRLKVSQYFKSVYFSRLIFTRTSGCLIKNHQTGKTSSHVLKNTLSRRNMTLEHAYIPNISKFCKCKAKTTSKTQHL